MKIVLTRVKKGKLKIEGEVYSQIKKGYLLLVGFEPTDTKEIVEKVSEKILSLRIFADSNGLTNLSIFDVKGEILCVSQFTLYADITGGRRPSFINAAKPDIAQPLYEYMCEYLGERIKLSPGVFGADMQIESTNDGPFTLVIDSKELLK